jgi:hypothetical protein
VSRHATSRCALTARFAIASAVTTASSRTWPLLRAFSRRWPFSPHEVPKGRRRWPSSHAHRAWRASRTSRRMPSSFARDGWLDSWGSVRIRVECRHAPKPRPGWHCEIDSLTGAEGRSLCVRGTFESSSHMKRVHPHLSVSPMVGHCHREPSARHRSGPRRTPVRMGAGSSGRRAPTSGSFRRIETKFPPVDSAEVRAPSRAIQRFES